MEHIEFSSLSFYELYETVCEKVNSLCMYLIYVGSLQSH